MRMTLISPGHGARAVLLIILVLSAACAREAAPVRTIEFSGPTMGTAFSVKIVPGEDGLVGDARIAVDQAIRDLLQRVDQLMSTWREDSELSRFNASRSLDPFEVSPETFEVISAAIDIARETAGALDVTIAPIIDLWGFGPDGRVASAPTDEALDAVMAAVGIHLLELDADRRTVRKRHPEVRVELSSIAPGYAADRIGDLLAARGFRDFLVDVSGELVARGRNEARLPWQVAIERPQSVGRGIARVVPLLDTAIATSGDYRNYREEDGVRLTHILDPRTRRPIQHRLASATVVDRQCIRADALSTALMVMGPEEGLAFAEREGLAVLLLVRQPDGSFAERASRAFVAMLNPET
jgi:FAD:protein FMN transferase